MLVAASYLIIGHTSLVVLKLPTEIVIAADSKRTDPRVAGLSMTACKIVRTSSFAFAATGYNQDEATGFNVSNLAFQASRTPGDISEKVRFFEQQASEQLVRSAEWFQANDQRVFELLLRTNAGFSIVFAGLDSSTPVLYERSFTFSKDGDGRIEVSTWARNFPDPKDRDPQPLSAYGETDAIREFLATQRDSLSGETPVEVARRLVEMEIAAKPDKVGPPVDIIRVDRNGIQWVEKKSECPEIQDS